MGQGVRGLRALDGGQHGDPACDRGPGRLPGPGAGRPAAAGGVQGQEGEGHQSQRGGRAAGGATARPAGAEQEPRGGQRGRRGAAAGQQRERFGCGAAGDGDNRVCRGCDAGQDAGAHGLERPDGRACGGQRRHGQQRGGLVQPAQRVRGGHPARVRHAGPAGGRRGGGRQEGAARQGAQPDEGVAEGGDTGADAGAAQADAQVPVQPQAGGAAGLPRQGDAPRPLPAQAGREGLRGDAAGDRRRLW
mmetsp:Transcript_47716/g.121755  ORF Transcript_47716/g.121755 Transcript_47716/m.121755 type:complete len:247 (-) Transcript_47716:1463-2203(-)